MSDFDRLSTLMERFSLDVRPAPLEAATLVVEGRGGVARKALLRTGASGFGISADRIVFAAAVDWGGAANPLMSALPEFVEFDLENDDESRSLIALVQSELTADRCGSGSVVNRLCEVLLVRILRAQIEAGSAEPGLLAGLSDPRISRAIVAMHDQPGRQWRNEDLARIAGLSLSRFAEIFTTTVGEPPSAYLRQWRLILARQDVSRGHRIDAIARRYGYASPEGFARAFRKRFGENPIALRPRQAA